MSELPSGWAETTIGDVTETIRGVTYKKEEAKDSPEQGFVPVLRATNIGQALTYDELVYVPARCVSPEQYLRRGDIVLAASSGSRTVVGKAALVSHDWAGSFGAFCMTVRPNGEMNPRLLAYFMQTHEYRHRVSELSAGVNINNLKREHIETFRWRIPPLREQHRIAAQIEALLTDLDAAVATLKRVQANLKRYRASALRAACEGRLVPTEAALARVEGRTYETGEQLLKRILVERRANWEAEQLAKMLTAGKPPKNDDWKKKYKDPEPPNTSNLPELPEGWTWASMPQLTTVNDGMVTGPFGTLISKSDQRDSGVPVVGIPNITASGFVRGDWVHVEPEKAQELRRYFINPDDIVISRSGTVGEACVIGDAEGPLIMSTNLMRLRPLPSVESTWLVTMLRGSSTVGRQLQELCKGSTRPFLNLTILSAVAIALPPSSEQERILSEVARAISVTDQTADNSAIGAQRAHGLRQSILKRAFEGKLVPQDPNDEPASVLLERIRAERVPRKNTPLTNVKRGRRRSIAEGASC